MANPRRNATPATRSWAVNQSRRIVIWIKEDHTPEQPPAPPAERGRRLLTASRGRDEELRVSLDEYESRPYLALRIWAKGSDGAWWPTKKGVSIRVREIPEVIDALMEAEEALTGHEPAPSRTRERDDR
jgi:hypothetical protein